jgi:hypothetical protein
MAIINKYGYCGFTIKTAFTDNTYQCIIDPSISDINTYSHHDQFSSEKETEEEIDKYLEKNNNKICQ